MVDQLIVDLRQAISQSDIKHCLALLKKNLPSFASYESEILGFEARYNNYLQDKIRGLISIDEQTLLFNRLLDNLLMLIQKIDPKEDRVELSGLETLGKKLDLMPQVSDKKSLFYKRFRTGEIFKLSVPFSMRTRTLREQLVDVIIPDYKSSRYLREEVGFELINLRNEEALDESISLSENGLNEGDTVYLRRFFFEESEEEEE